MRETVSASEDEVIEAFVRAELDSPKVGRLYAVAAAQLGISIGRLQPSDRRVLLRAVRGFPDRLLFDGFPRDVRWARVQATIDDLRQLRYIKIGNWLELAPKTRTVAEGVRQMRGIGFFIPEIDMDGCEAIAARVRAGAQLPPLILARAGSGPLTIVEGNSRATAYVAFPDLIVDELEVLIGSTDAFTRWRFY